MFEFGLVLSKFMERDGRYAEQISKKTAKIDPINYPVAIPRGTIVRWQKGTVKKPQSIENLLLIAIVLRLEQNEADKLLTSAHHPPVSQLLTQVPLPYPTLLEFWQNKTSNIPFQAPKRLHSFIGRTQQLETLQHILLYTDTQLVTLYGMGGVGKTSLALETAYQLKHHFYDGVLWFNLLETDTMSILQTIGEAYAIDVSKQIDIGSRSSKIRSSLANKRLLLVLDNATDKSNDLLPLIPPTGMGKVIITTRHRNLAISDEGEKLYVPVFNDTEILTILEIVTASEINVPIERLKKIAHQLGCLPLALSILLNRLKNDPIYTTEQFLKGISSTENQQLSLLKRGTDYSVRASFGWSYDYLEEPVKQAFQSLGVLGNGSFAFSAIEALNDINNLTLSETICSLYNLSFLEVTTHTERFRLHPLLHKYSYEKLHESGRINIVKEKMVKHFSNCLENNEQDSQWLKQEESHLLQMLNTAEELGMKDIFVKGVNALYEFWAGNGRLQLAKTFLDRALIASKKLNDRHQYLLIVKNLGHVAQKSGQLDEAKKNYQLALELAQVLENEKLISELLTKLGNIAYWRGNLQQAEDYYQEAKIFAEQAENNQQLAYLQTNLGLIAKTQGRLDVAESLYKEALKFGRMHNHIQLIITILQNYGELLEDSGRYSEAEKLLQDGLQLAQELKDPELISRLQGNLGLVILAKSQPWQAISHFRIGLQIAQEHQLLQQECRQRANLGLVRTSINQYQNAQLEYTDALHIATANSFQFEECRIINSLGHCYLSQEDYTSAKSYFQQAGILAQQLNDKKQLALSAYGLAKIAHQRGDRAESKRFGQKSYTIFNQINHIYALEVKAWLAELFS